MLDCEMVHTFMCCRLAFIPPVKDVGFPARFDNWKLQDPWSEASVELSHP
jgi:hypothetical protein